MNQFNINYAIVLTRDTFLYVLLFALCPAVALPQLQKATMTAWFKAR